MRLFQGDYKPPKKSIRQAAADKVGVPLDEFDFALKSIAGDSEFKDKLKTYEERERMWNIREECEERADLNGKSALDATIKYYKYVKTGKPEEEDDEEEDGEGEPEENDEDSDDESDEELDKEGKPGKKGGVTHHDGVDFYDSSHINCFTHSLIINYLLSANKGLDYQEIVKYIPDENGSIVKQKKAETFAECANEYARDARPEFQKLMDLAGLNYYVNKYYRIEKEIKNVVLFLDISGSMNEYTANAKAVLKYFVQKSERKEVNLCIVLFEERTLHTCEINIPWKILETNFPSFNYGGTDIQASIADFQSKRGTSEYLKYDVFFEDTTEYIIVNDGQDRCNKEFTRKTHCISLDGVNEDIKDKVIKSGGHYLTIDNM